MILEWIRSLKKQGAYVDVGAHIGNHTLFFAAFCPSTAVVAIEGHPTIRGLLKGNLDRNLTGIERKKIDVIEAAAWSESGETVQFAEIPRNNAGHTHVVNTGGRRGEKPSVEQKTVALDDIVIRDKVAILKIDVEDTEEQVIEGARALIDLHRPLIIIERHTKEQLAATLRQLEPYKYHPFKEWRGVHTFALRPA